jgi:hypothetical protein
MSLASSIVLPVNRATDLSLLNHRIPQDEHLGYFFNNSGCSIFIIIKKKIIIIKRMGIVLSIYKDVLHYFSPEIEITIIRPNNDYDPELEEAYDHYARQYEPLR